MAGFFFALPDGAGLLDTNTVEEIHPAPTSVDYPPLHQQRLDTTDGIVVQQSTRPSGVFRWLWSGYRTTMGVYQTLISQLEPLRSRYRLEDGETYPYVFLKEEMTGLLRSVTISSGTVTPSHDFFKVRVLAVSKTLRQSSNSSMVIIDPLAVEFVIHDTDFDLG